jgi:hypothetical protein
MSIILHVDNGFSNDKNDMENDSINIYMNIHTVKISTGVTVDRSI